MHINKAGLVVLSLCLFGMALGLFCQIQIDHQEKCNAVKEWGGAPITNVNGMKVQPFYISLYWAEKNCK